MTDKRCALLGYEIDLLSFEEACSYAVEKIKAHKGLHIVTINPEIIAAADKNKKLRDIIKASELVIPESSGIIGALMFKGIKQEKIPGIDFAKELIKYCSELNYSLALTGAEESVNEQAAENLKKEFPALNIVYRRNGFFENAEETAAEIKNSGAQLVLCALGAPKQELFIDLCRKSGNNAVFIGIGGSFDVWAGKTERAPEIYRKLWLEWLYRTIKEPKRLKRIYKTLPMFLFRAIIDSMNTNKGNDNVS